MEMFLASIPLGETESQEKFQTKSIEIYNQASCM